VPGPLTPPPSGFGLMTSSGFCEFSCFPCYFRFCMTGTLKGLKGFFCLSFSYLTE
jgi:hypothetical protein